MMLKAKHIIIYVPPFEGSGGFGGSDIFGGLLNAVDGHPSDGFEITTTSDGHSLVIKLPCISYMCMAAKEGNGRVPVGISNDLEDLLKFLHS
ncbi:hypothetical protein RRF57_008046 [Xylaria bambusicola]|uniref:Uncharacterized protein n=1 Tax=Xylaria bambusicola TaxID=326684 RepID=A0AAN7Z7Y5_9PEZI